MLPATQTQLVSNASSQIRVASLSKAKAEELQSESPTRSHKFTSPERSDDEQQSAERGKQTGWSRSLSSVRLSLMSAFVSPRAARDRASTPGTHAGKGINAVDVNDMRLARELGAVSGKLKIEADTAKASVFELTTLLEESSYRETLMILEHKILNEELEGAMATILVLQDNLAQLKMDAAAARRAQFVKLSDIHDSNDELLPTVLAALHNSGEAEGKGAGRVEIDLHLQLRNEITTEDGHIKVRAHVHVDDDADGGGFLCGSKEAAFGDKLQSQLGDENEDDFSDSVPAPPGVDGVLGVELQLQIEEDQQGHIGQIHIHELVSEDVCVSDNDVSAIVTARGGRGMQRAGGAVQETDSEKEDEQISHHHDAHICIPHCQRQCGMHMRHTPPPQATHTRAQATHTQDPSLSPRPEILSSFSLSLLPCVASATPSSVSSAVSHTLCHGPGVEIGGVLTLHNLDDMIDALARLESFVQSTTQHATQHNATQHVSAEAKGQASDEMGKRENESSSVCESHQNEACSDNIENEVQLSISRSMKEQYQQMLSELEGELGAGVLGQGGGVLGQVWQIP